MISVSIAKSVTMKRIDTFSDGTTSTVYILYHDDASEQVASFFKQYDWAHFHKLVDSKYLESSMLDTLKEKEDEWGKSDYVGFIVYNILKKQEFQNIDLAQVIVDSQNADVISFYKLLDPDMIDNTTFYHPQFRNIWTKLLTKIGYSEEEAQTDIPFYPCNCWIAKVDFMKNYIAFANHAKTILENDSELISLCQMDSDYHGKLSKERLMEIFGKTWYTYHPFIFERLPWFFAKMQKAKVYGLDIGKPTDMYPGLPS